MKNMAKLGLVIAMLISFSFNTNEKIEGVDFPDQLTVNGKTLVLNGGGVREKYWMDIYVAGLYLPKKSSDANQIINMDEPMALRLEMVSGLITSEKMIAATDEGFKKSAPNQLEALANDIQAFKDVFIKEELKDGDIYEFKYAPGVGTYIIKNNKQAALIGGLAFKKGLFGIWLCNDPADEDLKEGLLGLDD